jgi:hypothetical protein
MKPEPIDPPPSGGELAPGALYMQRIGNTVVITVQDERAARAVRDVLTEVFREMFG